MGNLMDKPDTLTNLRRSNLTTLLVGGQEDMVANKNRQRVVKNIDFSNANMRQP